MAIYGWNFNNTPIPDHVKRRFAQRKRFLYKGVLSLQGVCNTAEEAHVMVIQADNGRRSIVQTEPRRLGKELWYAIYT